MPEAPSGGEARRSEAAVGVGVGKGMGVEVGDGRSVGEGSSVGVATGVGTITSSGPVVAGTKIPPDDRLRTFTLYCPAWLNGSRTAQMPF